MAELCAIDEPHAIQPFFMAHIAIVQAVALYRYSLTSDPATIDLLRPLHRNHVFAIKLKSAEVVR